MGEVVSFSSKTSSFTGYCKHSSHYNSVVCRISTWTVKHIETFLLCHRSNFQFTQLSAEHRAELFTILNVVKQLMIDTFSINDNCFYSPPNNYVKINEMTEEMKCSRSSFYDSFMQGKHKKLHRKLPVMRNMFIMNRTVPLVHKNYNVPPTPPTPTLLYEEFKIENGKMMKLGENIEISGKKFQVGEAFILFGKSHALFLRFKPLYLNIPNELKCSSIEDLFDRHTPHGLSNGFSAGISWGWGDHVRAVVDRDTKIYTKYETVFTSRKIYAGKYKWECNKKLPDAIFRLVVYGLLKRWLTPLERGHISGVATTYPFIIY